MYLKMAHKLMLPTFSMCLLKKMFKYTNIQYAPSTLQEVYNRMTKTLSKTFDVPSPEDIPPDKLTPLSRKYIDWKTGMMVVIGVLMVFTFLHTFVTNPTISGLAVVDASTQDTARFSNMTSILLIVFAFFGLFIFIVTRKLKLGNR